MKIFDFNFFRKAPEETLPGFALRWCTLQDRPFVYIKKPDRDYWSSLHIELLLYKSAIWIEIRLTKLPFKNLEQYRIWLRQKRAVERLSS